MSVENMKLDDLEGMTSNQLAKELIRTFRDLNDNVVEVKTGQHRRDWITALLGFLIIIMFIGGAFMVAQQLQVSRTQRDLVMVQQSLAEATAKTTTAICLSNNDTREKAVTFWEDRVFPLLRGDPTIPKTPEQVARTNEFIDRLRAGLKALYAPKNCDTGPTVIQTPPN